MGQHIIIPTAPPLLCAPNFQQISSPINLSGPKSRSWKYRLLANFLNKFRVTKFYEILAALPLNSRLEITLLANLSCRLWARPRPGPGPHHTRMLSLWAASLQSNTVGTNVVQVVPAPRCPLVTVSPHRSPLPLEISSLKSVRSLEVFSLKCVRSQLITSL